MASEHPSVSLFRDYIRINSSHPDPDYRDCVRFLVDRAEAMGLEYNIAEMAEGKPVVWMTWEGLDPSLPSVLLNSHMDVVTSFPELWNYDPYEAFKDDDGNIFGRGTQDMKSIGIMHLEAVRRLKEDGKRFKRTIHISFVPDEEIGSALGMEKFIETNEFKALNVDFALDEGLPGLEKTVVLYYDERIKCGFQVICPGNPGHGLMFIDNTAGEKARYMIDKVLDYRAEQENKLNSNPKLSLADVTTVNWTVVKGGVMVNTTPTEIKLDFFAMVTPTTPIEDFREMIRAWMREAGEGVTATFSNYGNVKPTSVADSDPWFAAVKKAVDQHGEALDTRVVPGRTDACYLRKCGIPCFGLSPLMETPFLLHDNDEFVNEKTFLRGIDIMCDVVANVADVPK